MALGAAAVVDHHDATVVEKVKEATGDTIRLALDAIGIREPQGVSVAVIRPAGGKVVHTNPIILDSTGRTDVERECKWNLVWY